MTGGATPLVERALAAVSPDDLSAFLHRQRWFAAKGAARTAPTVANAVVLPWGDGAFAIARIVVDVDHAMHTYQVPVAARASAPAGVPGDALIATVDVDGASVAVYDAVHDADFRAGLAPAIDTGLVVPRDPLSRWVVEPIELDGHGPTPVGASRVGAAEQSNTSIVFGNETILKLFRRLVPGPNPEVEVTRFLTTRAGFRGTPALRAELRFEDGDGSTTSGVAVEYLADATDAWRYALDRGRVSFAAAGAARGGREDREPPNAFVDDARRLGAVTRAMHDALASDDDDPDFAPEPAAPEDLDRWAHRTQQLIRDSLGLLERRLSGADFPSAHVAEAQALVRRRDHYVGWINEIDDELGDDLGMRTRIHGDFHLGQVLRSHDGDFKIIDFEGEPSRSLSDRREKTSPLRDVAGMFRSFAYAAATLSQTEGKNLPPHLRELRSARWERDVRAAYLDGYLGDRAGDDEAGLLPEDDTHLRELLILFEAEKTFYELAYELNHRPAWVWIPMRGIAKLFMKR